MCMDYETLYLVRFFFFFKINYLRDLLLGNFVLNNF